MKKGSQDEDGKGGAKRSEELQSKILSGMNPSSGECADSDDEASSKSIKRKSSQNDSSPSKRRDLSPPLSEGTSRMLPLPIHAALEPRIFAPSSQPQQDEPMRANRSHVANAGRTAVELQPHSTLANMTGVPNSLGTQQQYGTTGRDLSSIPSHLPSRGALQHLGNYHLSTMASNLNTRPFFPPSSISPAAFAVSAPGTASANSQIFVPNSTAFSSGLDTSIGRTGLGATFGNLPDRPPPGLSAQDVNALLFGGNDSNSIFPAEGRTSTRTRNFLDHGLVGLNPINSSDTSTEMRLFQSLYAEVRGTLPVRSSGPIEPPPQSFVASEGLTLPTQQAFLRANALARAPLSTPNQESAGTFRGSPISEQPLLSNQGGGPASSATNVVPSGRSAPLYMDSDTVCLSKFQALARKQIELFEAMPADILAGARGRNNPIVLGQVGIRCRHCTCRPPQKRKRGSVYYPTKFNRVYQTAVNMAATHLCRYCEDIPKEIRDELLRLKDIKSIAGGGKDYWASGVETRGVIETEDGLRFGLPIRPRTSTG